MEEKQNLQIKVSERFISDLDDIYQYGVETFGLKQAEQYENEIWRLVDTLQYNWSLFSECKHLPTKSKMYRWIILESHLIIYRITEIEIQVLRAVHAKRSIAKIKSSRKIRFVL